MVPTVVEGEGEDMVVGSVVVLVCLYGLLCFALPCRLIE